MTVDDRVPGLVFGEAAADFDRVRWSYPAELVTDVLNFCRDGGVDVWGWPSGGRRALEVGAGTGKATLAFAERGVPIVAVEPDAAMAAILARHVARRPGVEIVSCTFEQYQPPESFGLLYCADAWHWIDPERRWRAASAALAPGGVLALFGNSDRIDDPALRRSLLSVVAQCAPTIVIRDTPAQEEHLFTTWPGNELAERPEFEVVSARVYRSHRVISRTDYLTYMSTRSQCRMLPPPVRHQLLAALAGVLPDAVPLAIDTVCYLARRVPGAQ